MLKDLAHRVYTKRSILQFTTSEWEIMINATYWKKKISVIIEIAFIVINSILICHLNYRGTISFKAQIALGHLGCV